MAITAGQYAALDTSAYGEVLNKCAQAVIDLDLTSIKGRVYVLQRTDDFALVTGAGNLPLCIVSMSAESANDQEGNLNTSTVHYPVMIAMIWGTDRGQRSNLAEQLLHRQSVARKFRKQRPFSGMTNGDLKKTTIRAGEPYVAEAVRKALDAQWLLVDATVEEVFP